MTEQEKIALGEQLYGMDFPIRRFSTIEGRPYNYDIRERENHLGESYIQVRMTQGSTVRQNLIGSYIQVGDLNYQITDAFEEDGDGEVTWYASYHLKKIK